MQAQFRIEQVAGAIPDLIVGLVGDWPRCFGTEWRMLLLASKKRDSVLNLRAFG